MTASAVFTPPTSVAPIKKLIAGSHAERMKIRRERRIETSCRRGSANTTAVPAAAENVPHRYCWRPMPCCQSQTPSAGEIASERFPTMPRVETAETARSARTIALA